MVLRTQGGLPTYDGEQIQIGIMKPISQFAVNIILRLKSIRRMKKMNIYDQPCQKTVEELGELLSDPDIVSTPSVYGTFWKEEAYSRYGTNVSTQTSPSKHR